ncbi:stage V sporulation protein E [Candidatus Kaiserbacteria bacterium CG10_big_fil_rev_8_21_14_0_10_56_12]|uniref:Probable peptidoglycan glycosyltransferase FtsW n=1 Tax=Candidatus Kaiserbacteria bacterium CG10_big_fil_rev_8_21_14_0_10_56_12 TaxID=1974611 RepID=A0A2H0UAL3_9BACT|nr:MAG: stage V sporulation protein E [Candidatus Kaiserbacteria bacterium CG10_big_fil_rev_8_21_14_0_10_56_12]
MRNASGDRVFFFLVLATALAGLAIFSSAALGLLARESSSVSRDIFVQAGLGLGLGFAALFLARAVPLAWFKTAAPYVYLGTLALTALVFVPGTGFHSGGATRWINLGFTTLQPAEFLKIGIVLVLAWWLAPRARELRNIKKGILPFSAFLAVPAALLLAQPNTSTTLLILATGAVMYFAAGAPLRDFGILILGVVVALALVAAVRPYVLERIKTFIDPTENSLGSGYQIQQSMIAIGSGGLLGRGFGQSVEKFNYLPEPDGDSVFAVFAEETGFIGATLLLLLLTALAARGIVIASGSRDLFGGLVALGFSSLIMLQVFINVSAMLGIIPLTGLPLPFVSHGGTALMAALLMCGIVLNVARHKKT